MISISISTEKQKCCESRKGLVKQFLEGQSLKLTTDLLILKRKMVKIITSLFTGHCRLKSHMCTIGLVEGVTRRFYEEEKITKHWQDLDQLNYLQVNTKIRTTNSYTKDPL